MAHSLLLCGAMLGVDVSIASPKMYQPDKAVVNQAMQIAEKTNAIIEITTDIAQATLNAHYVYTDVWASMGKEKEAKKRHRAFAKYKVTLEILQNYAPHAKVMHCLPAHRGEEIDDDVIESSHSIIFDQAENRLHVQKALLCLLMK
jgi:ornithine carbamoyltransferase